VGDRIVRVAAIVAAVVAVIVPVTEAIKGFFELRKKEQEFQHEPSDQRKRPAEC
jgi:hypothetical protein